MSCHAASSELFLGGMLLCNLIKASPSCQLGLLRTPLLNAEIWLCPVLQDSAICTWVNPLSVKS